MGLIGNSQYPPESWVTDGTYDLHIYMAKNEEGDVIFKIDASYAGKETWFPYCECVVDPTNVEFYKNFGK